MNDTNSNQIAKILTLYSETNIHTGIGQSTGAIDLPVDRERHTDFPVFASSGMKGALREKAEGIDEFPVEVVFGPEVTGGGGHAGALSVSQANLLAFPVRSLTNVFQWVTCPMVLGRLERDLGFLTAMTSSGSLKNLDALFIGDENKDKGYVIDLALYKNDSDDDSEVTVILEDLSLKLDEADNVKEAIGFIRDNLLVDDSIKSRFGDSAIIISDEDFRYLVKHTTEVRARIKLNDQKTTTGGDGNLWYEETLPRDCLFYSLVRCMKSMDKENEKTAEDVENLFKTLLPDGSYLRVGGNETVGMGWCATNIYGGEE